MQPIDFSRLLDVPTAAAALPTGAKLSRDAYETEQGLQFRCEDSAEGLTQELVRIGDDAYLFATHCARRQDGEHSQIVNGSDWVHVQFRLDGGGRERLPDGHIIETPAYSCVVTRYTENTVIQRCFDEAERWRAVCLLLTPGALAGLLGASASRLPPSIHWLTMDAPSERWTMTLPLHSVFALPVTDILSCELQGCARYIFMRAKSLELLAGLISAIEKESAQRHVPIRLSASDQRGIALARMIMIANLETPITLAQLAKRVGLNRTKLALGFKQIYGSSLQAYWRDLRLSRARALLKQQGTRVTDVALKMGYSELSSFTRAFNRRFGVLPRQCKDIVD